MFNNYSKIASNTKYRSIYGEELKMLTKRQVPQILSIPLAQVKAGNTSENLVNQIRLITYSLIEQNKFLKEYTTV